MTNHNEPNAYRIDPDLVDKLVKNNEDCQRKWATVSREQYRAIIEEDLAPVDVRKSIAENSDKLEKHLEYFFSTSDGRKFGVYRAGERLMKLFEYEEIHINRRDIVGVERLKTVAGFILEIGSEDEPFVCVADNGIELAQAWESLHQQYDVPPTEAENDDYLDVILHGFPKYESLSSSIDDSDDEDTDEDTGRTETEG